MIILYGDSHAHYSFKNLDIKHIDKHQNSITMFRIGRDNTIINHHMSHDINNIYCLSYGEIDCRCYIHKQIMVGGNEVDIICDLIKKYFITIKNNIAIYKKIVIVGIIPPTKQDDYEKIHGRITHEFPFIGTDDDRVRYTFKMNKKIEEYCNIYKYQYFNPYEFYTNENGYLKYELSDNCVHIGNNAHFIEEFKSMIYK